MKCGHVVGSAEGGKFNVNMRIIAPPLVAVMVASAFGASVALAEQLPAAITSSVLDADVIYWKRVTLISKR